MQKLEPSCAGAGGVGTYIGTATSFLGISPKGLKAGSPRNTCTATNTALSTRAGRMRPPRRTKCGPSVQRNLIGLKKERNLATCYDLEELGGREGKME